MERAHSGAGLVPCRFVDGEPQFLLGREREVRDWVGSLRWSGLEGSCKGSESIVTNALREAFEESAGLLFKDNAERDRIAREISEGSYHLRVSVESDSKAHVTFVKMLPLPDDLPARFAETRAYLACYARRRRGAVKEGAGGWKSVGATAGMQCPEPPNSSCINHPALRNIHRRTGVTERVASEDYLEKIELRWVSLPQLRDALEGKTGCDIRLRPLFSLVAQAIVDQFSMHGKSCTHVG